MTREEWLESPGCKLVADDLKKTLEGMCDHLFGPVSGPRTHSSQPRSQTVGPSTSCDPPPRPGPL